MGWLGVVITAQRAKPFRGGRKLLERLALRPIFDKHPLSILDFLRRGLHYDLISLVDEFLEYAHTIRRAVIQRHLPHRDRKAPTDDVAKEIARIVVRMAPFIGKRQ